MLFCIVVYWVVLFFKTRLFFKPLKIVQDKLQKQLKQHRTINRIMR